MSRTARARRDPVPRPLRVLFRRPLLVGIAALVTVALTTLTVTVVILTSLTSQVDRANQMITALRDGHAAMLNQETGLRGYLITRDPSFLEPYEDGAAASLLSDHRLLQLGQEDPRMGEHFSRLRLAEARFVAQWVQPTLRSQPAVDDRVALAALLERGKTLFDEYRAIEEEVRAMVQERRAALYAQQRMALMGGAVLGLLVALVVAVGFRRSHQRLVAQVVPPTQELRDTLSALADGAVDSRARASGPKELRDIAEDVNALGEALQDRNALVAARERDLVAARDDAERAGQAKTAFLATMSHEIRTPLNAVIGLTDLLLRTQLTDEQRNHLETVSRSGDSLLALINDVLDFSKIEAGELDLEAAPFDLDGLVYDVAQMLGPQAAAKGLDLLVDVRGDGGWRLVGDATRMRQVVVNLVGNAVKFTSSGHVLVTVDGAPAGDRRRCRLSVTDTGIGIPAEHRHRLFRSFSQGDASITRSYGGTGLGLAISQRIVEAMGGGISVESRAGAGSTFTVGVELEVAAGAPRSTPTAPLTGRRLLVVDDNPTNLRILQDQLERFGAACVLAHDGTEAVAAVEAGARFDACLLDLHMPGMGGDELAALLRDHPRTADAPLVLLSSSTGLLPAGAALFAARLHKPVRPERLLGALLTLLDPAGGRARAGAAPGAGPAPGAAPRADGPARRLRVLVAEDHEVNAQLIALYLDQLGHDRVRVGDGRAAVDAVAAGACDVVLMDAQMPGMGGVEATAAIRRSPGPQPRIIAVTASALVGDRDAFLGAGADDFLTKPVRLATLDEALRRWTATPADPGGPAASTPEADVHATPDRRRDAGEALDAETVEELRDLGEEAFSHLYEQYVDSLTATVDALVGAAGRADFAEDDDASVPRLAHRLKGSSAAMGALRLADVCQRLQELGGPSLELELALVELQAERARVSAAVSTLFDAPG